MKVMQTDSSWQIYRTATLPNAVSVSLKESGAAITLSWSKNSQATGYKIYRMSGDTKGRYVLYKTITSNSTTSFRCLTYSGIHSG